MKIRNLSIVAALILGCIAYAQEGISRDSQSDSLICAEISGDEIEALIGKNVMLRSWKGDYLHRPESPQGVTTWNTGPGNEWTVERGPFNSIMLRSWKGDYLHRPDSPQGVTMWNTGIGNEWRLERGPNNSIVLRSWKGDYLHRPDSPQGVTTWNTGGGNEWILWVKF